MLSEEVLITCSVNSEELNENELNLEKSIHNNLTDLSGFKLKDILQNITNRKAVFLRGNFDSEEGEAVVILEKTAFSEDNLLNNTGNYFPGNHHLEKIFQNDVYGDYKYITDSVLNSK